MRCRSSSRYLTLSAEHATTTRGWLSGRRGRGSLRHALASVASGRLAPLQLAHGGSGDSRQPRSTVLVGKRTPAGHGGCNRRVLSAAPRSRLASTRTFRSLGVQVVSIQEAGAQLSSNLSSNGTARAPASAFSGTSAATHAHTRLAAARNATDDNAQRQRRCCGLLSAKTRARSGRRARQACPASDRALAVAGNTAAAFLKRGPRPWSRTMLGWVVAVILLGYLVPHFIVGLLPAQDLKKKVGRAARGAHASPPAHAC